MPSGYWHPGDTDQGTTTRPFTPSVDRLAAMARAFGVGAAMLVAALAAVSVFFAPAVTAQTGSCDDALPAELVGNYSGMACSPVWNNFVLRVSHCRREPVGCRSGVILGEPGAFLITSHRTDSAVSSSTRRAGTTCCGWCSRRCTAPGGWGWPSPRTA